MSIDLHGRPDTGVPNGFGEGGQIEVRVILMLDVIVGHVGMAKAVNSYIMSQTDLFTDLPMALAGTAADAIFNILPMTILDLSMTLLEQPSLPRSKTNC